MVPAARLIEGDKFGAVGKGLTIEARAAIWRERVTTYDGRTCRNSAFASFADFAVKIIQQFIVVSSSLHLKHSANS